MAPTVLLVKDMVGQDLVVCGKFLNVRFLVSFVVFVFFIITRRSNCCCTDIPVVMYYTKQSLHCCFVTKLLQFNSQVANCDRTSAEMIPPTCYPDQDLCYLLKLKAEVDHSTPPPISGITYP